MKSAYLKMHLSIFLWGFTGIFGRLIELREDLLVIYRMAITSLILYILIRFKGNLEKLSLRDLLKIMGTGFIVMIHWLAFYGAIKKSNISVALSCLACTALFTAFLEPLMNQKKSQRLSVSEIGTALLALSGIGLIFYSGQSLGKGVLLGVLASFLGAIFTIINKNLVADHKAETVTFFEISGGFIFLCILLPFLQHFFPADKMMPSATDWIYLILFSVFCTVIPFLLSLSALKQLSAFTINLALNLEPVYGIILAILLFREDRELGPAFYAGSFLTLGSVILYTYLHFRKIKNPNHSGPGFSSFD